MNFATVQPFTLKRPGLGYGTLKCVALKAIRFEHSEREKAKGLPMRKIKQAIFVDTSRYTGKKLRELEARNGVGRPFNTAQAEIYFARAA